MVVVRLDLAEDLGCSSDCFVSVRIGDAQKLSRLSSSRTYHFPQAGDRRYGKIEVFRRIGACGVDVDPANNGLRQVHIGCGDSGALRLNVAVQAEPGVKCKGEQVVAKEEEKPSGGKVKAAKDYLNKHGIEFILSEAMQAMLRIRPDDPAKFLAEKLLGSSTGGGVALPAVNGAMQDRPAPDAGLITGARRAYGGNEPLSPQSAANQQSRPQKLEPLRAPPAPVLPTAPRAAAPAALPPQPPGPARPSPALLPFKEYYASHFHELGAGGLAGLYAGFPGPKRPGASPPAPALPPAPKSAAPLPQEPKATLPAASVRWEHKPSVATWLSQPQRPVPPAAAAAPAQTKVAAPAPVPAPMRAVAAPALLRSVGVSRTQPTKQVVLSGPAIYGPLALSMGRPFVFL